MGKKAGIFLIIALIFAFGISAAGGASEKVSVYVDGKEIKPDVPAMMIEGTTMLPFRAILNSLGVADKQISWKNSSQSVQIKTDKTYIFLAVGVEGAIVNQGMVNLPAAPMIVDGRVLVPLRFISEALGARVNWDGAANTVTIDTR